MTLPRGIRNNNPGNIIKSDATWKGKIEGDDTRFEIFDTSHNGLRALAKQLLIYQDKYGLRTVREIINRWAPSVENDTESYENQVSLAIGYGVDYPLDLHVDYVLAKLVTAIVKHENGQQPYTDQQILAATQDALGYSYTVYGETQPAAPIEERTPEVTPMPDEQPVAIDWAKVTAFGGAVASFFNPIVGAALTALSPLLQEKVAKSVGRHTDPATAKTIAANLSEAVMTSVKSVTGKADDLEAVVALRKSPEAIAKVEQATLSKLDEIAPFIEKIAAIEERERAADEDSRDRAADRAAKDPLDMGKPLVISALAFLGVLMAFFGAVVIIEVVTTGKSSTESWAALVGIGGWAMGVGTMIYAYRFGSTSQSQAKNVLLGELAKRK